MIIPFFQNYPKIQQERAEEILKESIKLALLEDGKDLSAEGIFTLNHRSQAYILTKEESFAVGLPLIPLIFYTLFNMPDIYSFANSPHNKENTYKYEQLVQEGTRLAKNTKLCTIEAPTIALLKAERVILNFITHFSGIANLTYSYVQALENTAVTLLDTRKTMPSMRYLEKYAVLCAGAKNHRLALDDMIMLKDNHIDALGSITSAVQKTRESYSNHSSALAIEVECRTIEDVREAVDVKVERIMLDNMSNDMLKEALILIPLDIEAEISGNVSLENIRELALICPERKPDFISVGKITHSAPVADFSMKW